ncbi:unnamed protein product [Dibothriocephalus latus]|uniref:Ubiquinone biosynthesis monooxygenase COQ7 n=1 Tax=Dibothriocephalus latus TaxID=60516 RepID=A0A3P7Q3E3_DIBLA|nr:unnamed protein product [Dibothriocephalus latus]
MLSSSLLLTSAPLCRLLFTSQHMLDQEKHHLKTFEELIPKNRVRPTALLPIFSIAAYAVGVATALLGEKSAMACTVAVESVVGNHYNDQIRELLQEDPKAHAELLQTLKQFRDEEMEHHDTGLANEAEMVRWAFHNLALELLCSLLLTWSHP